MFHSRLLAAAVLPAFFMLSAGAAPQLQAKPPVTTIHKTTKPGGIFGYWGPDVFASQKVAARFTVPADGDMQLGRLGIYLMNNSDTLRGTVRLSLQTDLLDEGGSETLPSGIELERWSMQVQTLGWNPVEQVVTSVEGAPLRAGANYWVVAESDSAALENPVWNFAATGTGWSTTTLNGAWQTAGSGAALTLRVNASKRGPGLLPEVNMSLDSTTIRSGERTLMRWDTRRAGRCYADGAWSGQWPTEDSVYVSPFTPGIYEYMLTCTNPNGRGGAKVTLQVLPAQ